MGSYLDLLGWFLFVIFFYSKWMKKLDLLQESSGKCVWLFIATKRKDRATSCRHLKTVFLSTFEVTRGQTHIGRMGMTFQLWCLNYLIPRLLEELLSHVPCHCNDIDSPGRIASESTCTLCYCCLLREKWPDVAIAFQGHLIHWPMVEAQQVRQVCSCILAFFMHFYAFLCVFTFNDLQQTS